MGQHFGEVSMIFQCKRSATELADNYITCASLNRLKYNELLTIYPKLNDLFKNEIIQYSDPLKCFMEMHLN